MLPGVHFLAPAWAQCDVKQDRSGDSQHLHSAVAAALFVMKTRNYMMC